MKFKVGDRVRVVREGFGHSAKAGMTGVIVIHTERNFGVRFDNAFTGGHSLYGECEDGYGQWLPGYCIEPIGDNHKIVITSDGKTTLARLYEGKKVVKSAEAKCSPDDEFDFTKGAKIAFERLMEEKPKYKEVHRKAKVGEYVRLVAEHGDGRGGYSEESYDRCGIYQVEAVDVLAEIRSKQGALLSFFDDEYVVLEGYKPEDKPEAKPKYYSGKLVCVKSDYRWWTAGKVYEVVDGKVFDDECTERERILDVADMNDKMYGCARFIELKE